MPGRPLLPRGGYREAPYPCGWEEEGLTSQAARIIPKDSRVSGVCLGVVPGVVLGLTPRSPSTCI